MGFGILRDINLTIQREYSYTGYGQSGNHFVKITVGQSSVEG